MDGWKRKFAEEIELVHYWQGDKTVCGIEKEKALYLNVDIETFPAHKVCPECLKRRIA